MDSGGLGRSWERGLRLTEEISRVCEAVCLLELPPHPASELSGASRRWPVGVSPSRPDCGLSWTNLSLSLASPARGLSATRGGRRSRAVSTAPPHVTWDNGWIKATLSGFRNVLPGLLAEPPCGTDGGMGLRGVLNPSARSGAMAGLVHQWGRKRDSNTYVSSHSGCYSVGCDPF